MEHGGASTITGPSGVARYLNTPRGRLLQVIGLAGMPSGDVGADHRRGWSDKADQCRG